MRVLRSLGQALLAIPPALRWLPAAAWIALIWTLSSRSIAVPTGTGLGLGVFWNLAHPFEFGVLAIFMALLLPRQNGWPRLDTRAALGLVITLIGMAIADELHQSTVPERNASLLDVLSDSVGAWYAIAAVRRVGESDSRALTGCVLRGLCACVMAALAATLGAMWFPEIDWL